MARSKALVAINLCSIRPRQLSGPSVYAMWLTEELLKSSAYRWLVYCHRELEVPKSWEEPARIRRVLGTVRKPLRVAFEQCLLPLHAARDGVELIFSPNFVSPLWGGGRRAVTIHDMYYKVMPEVLPRWQRAYWQVFVSASARRSHAVLAVSQSTAADVNRFIPGTARKTWITRLACAVEDPSTSGTMPDGIPPHFILWVANVVGNKNPEAVAELAGELRRRQTPIRLVHVGSDVHGLFETALIHAGVTDVLRLGRVAAGQLRWLYRNAVCVIQPSHYEGFGIPVLEAQQLGAPLICSDIPPLREVAGDGARFFPPREPMLLANEVLALWNDPRAREDLAKKGRANAARFSWSRTADATLAAFKSVLSG